jgi:hypothetical protein
MLIWPARKHSRVWNARHCWKVKGGTTGYGNARSLQPCEQHALCKMAYSVEESESIAKTFYKTSIYLQWEPVSEEIRLATSTGKTCNQPYVIEVWIKW